MSQTTAAISNNNLYLDYVKQATVGILMGSLQFLSIQEKLTPKQSMAMFFHPPNQSLALNLMYDLLKKYIQTSCDEFCSVYYDVYIQPKISFKEALVLNGDHFIFSHFNKIFENSRSNIALGPKHLNCLVMCTLANYMPLLFPTILAHYEEPLMGFSTSSRDGNWHAGERTIVRAVLQELVQESIDWLNVNKQEELNQMPFVCKDDSCNKNWDLFNFPADEQAIAVQNIKKFWSELQQQEGEQLP